MLLGAVVSLDYGHQCTLADPLSRHGMVRIWSYFGQRAEGHVACERAEAAMALCTEQAFAYYPA